MRTRLPLAAAWFTAVMLASPARAGHEDDRPESPPNVVVLGQNVARLDVRHDVGAGSLEIRVASQGLASPVLVEPILVVGGVRLPLARVEGKDQVWKVVHPSLATPTLAATFETRVDEKTYTVTLASGTRASGAVPHVHPQPPATAPVPAPRPPVRVVVAPPPARIGPKGGRLLTLGQGGVIAEAVHDPVAGKLTIHLRSTKDDAPVPLPTQNIMQGPVAVVLLPGGAAARLEFVPAEMWHDGKKAAVWSTTSEALKTTSLEGRLRVRVADTPLEANLGGLDVSLLDPPLEERISLHGGRIVVFGEGAFHGEIVHDQVAGTLRIWFQDSNDKTPIPVGESPVLELRQGDRILEIGFDPVREKLHPKILATGRTDQWLATHELLKAPALVGRIRVRLADRPFSTSLAPGLGRRGGRLVSLEGTPARVEVVRDRERGTVTLYVLDWAGPATLFSEAPTLTMVDAQGRAFPVTFVPVEGRASAFRASHEDLRGDVSGHRVRMRVGERAFDEPIEGETVVVTAPPPAPAPPAAEPAPTAPAPDSPPPDSDPGSRGDRDPVKPGEK